MSGLIALAVLPFASFPAPTAIDGPAKAEAVTKLKLPLNKRIVLAGTLSQKVTDHAYVFRAKKGTRLKLTLKAVKGEVVPYYSIAFPSGKTFGQKGYDPFSGWLTENGAYTLTVHVNNMASNGTWGAYRLTIKATNLPTARKH